MPLFDLHPKDSPRTLFGRERELAELVRLIRAGRWVVVLGPRMVGKTSLVRAANPRFGRPAVYVNLWGARGTLGLVNAFVAGLNANRPLLHRARRTLERLEGVTVGPLGITLASPRRPLRTVWELVDAIGREERESVIELDEVQEIGPAAGALHKLLAQIFTTHPKVGFVFTGSRFGLVRTLLDPTSDSPLYGRAPATLALGPFPEAASVEFLRRGLLEYRMKVPTAALTETVRRSLDGLPGWLALFGSHLAVDRMAIGSAESATLSEGVKVARTELAHFLVARDAPVYWEALRGMAPPGIGWTDLRDRLSRRRGTPVNDNTIRRVLQALSDSGLILRVEDRYRIADPMIARCVASSRHPPTAR